MTLRLAAIAALSAMGAAGCAKWHSRRSGAAEVRGVAPGGAHACVWRADGTVWCWGRNTGGLLGVGAKTAPVEAPLQVPGLSGVQQVAAYSTDDEQVTCALGSDGLPRCWGSFARNGIGRALISDLTKPVVVPGSPALTQLSVGRRHTCGVEATGRVWCWGGGIKHAEAEAVPDLNDAASVSVGDDYACAVRRSGGVRCWGTNLSGTLGGGTYAPVTWDWASPGPIPWADVAGLTDAVQVSAGAWHACALRKSGDVWCWGSNNFGVLGRLGARSAAPLQVAGLEGVRAVAAGDTSSCALTAGGVLCWGTDADGRWIPPRPVEGLDDASEVEARGDLFCAVRSSGAVACWGRNRSAVLGVNADAWVPEPVPAFAGATDIEDSEWNTCALVDGGALCQPRFPSRSHAIRFVAGAAAMVSGDDRACVVQSDAGATCWEQAEAVLSAASDAVVNRLPPAASPLPNLGPAAQLAAGLHFECALRQSGRVACEGDNSTGQLGQGDLSAHAGAVEVSGIDDATALFAGSRHTCAVRRSGALTCWGNSARGQLGFVGPGGETPRTLAAIPDAAGGGAGRSETCAIRRSRSVTCWGPRLPSPRSYPPTDIANTANAVSVAPADDHSCLVNTAGEVLCWGRNNFGQLGDGSTLDSWEIAVKVRDLTDATKVTAVVGRTCALRKNGQVLCWGRPEGQLFDPQRHPLVEKIPVTILQR